MDDGLKKELNEVFVPNVLAYRLLVRAPYFPEKTKGGVIITSNTREDLTKFQAIGKIVVLGDDCFKGKTKMFEFDVGDWVIYSKYEREQFVINFKGEALYYYFVNDDRILAKIDEKEVLKVTNGGI